MKESDLHQNVYTGLLTKTAEYGLEAIVNPMFIHRKPDIGYQDEHHVKHLMRMLADEYGCENNTSIHAVVDVSTINLTYSKG